MRTLDSVKRALAVFPNDKIIFVSQSWHRQRALWLVDRMTVSPNRFSFYSADFGDEPMAYFNFLRDLLAKPRAVIDWMMGSKMSTKNKFGRRL
jgi:vancomycin permeability regulator SanA